MTGPQDADQTPTWAAPGAATPPARPAQPDQPLAPADQPPAAPPAAPTSWGTVPTPPYAGQQPSDQPVDRPVDQPPAPYGQQPPYPQQPYPQQPYGEPAYGQAPYPPAGYGPAAPGYGPGAWQAPAARPGIIPLRPLNLGEILDGAFRAVRANPTVMFGLSLMVIAVAVLLKAVLTWYIGGLLSGELTTWLDEQSLQGEGFDSESSSLLGASFAQLVALPVSALASTVLTGLLIVSVSRSVIGRKVTISEVLRSGRVWHVVGFTLLIGVASALALGALVTVGVLIARTESWGLFALYVVAAVVVVVVVSVWVSVRTLLVPAALMLEERRFWPTVARAWRLTRGSFWRLFGIYLLLSVIVGIVAQIIQYPVTLVLMFVVPSTDVLSFGAIAATSVGEILALTLTTVFMSSVVALLYIDTRMRREGLDIELARAAEQTR